jgi:kinesin family protein 11
MYHATAIRHMSTLQQAARTLVEQGAQEDVQTGMTPRKSVWQYTDQWDLTKDREAILKGWKERGISNIVGETFTAEPEHEKSGLSAHDRTDTALDGPATSPVMSDHPQVFDPAESPVSLASSLSSTSCMPTPIPVPRHAQVLKKPSGSNKSGLPTVGTLTDRPINVLMNRPRKVR